jgi:hypothetical protein
MPRYDTVLASQAKLARDIATAGETVRVSGGEVGRREWTTLRLEALYELAYLRVFAEWESCLERTFYRSLCGYASRTGGQETLHSGTYFGTLAAAEAAVLRGNPFVLWHNPMKVVARCRQFVMSGVPGCPGRQETTIASNQARLIALGAIRHRIVHTHQEDARRNFDAATNLVAARTYPASRPGKFLRDWDLSTPPRRWLEATTSELVSLMAQMV